MSNKAETSKGAQIAFQSARIFVNDEDRVVAEHRKAVQAIQKAARTLGQVNEGRPADRQLDAIFVRYPGE